MGLLVAVVSLAVAATAGAGECTQATFAPAIIAACTTAHPDSLPVEAGYTLGCTSFPLYEIIRRGPRNLPSWRLLRNTRREMRDLGRNRELIAALEHVAMSHDWSTRRSACLALALYGQTAYADSVYGSIDDPDRVMIRAFVGRADADSFAIAAWPRADNRIVLLDAIYYTGTAKSVAFIRGVAAEPGDAALQERAQWMLAHPMPVEDSWRL